MEKYDAFISYRHLPPDMAVASRLQVLLENSRLCRREKPLCIFRDQSELQSGNDLGQEIRDALLQSRYLVVVCSEQIKDSLWCMEEIRLFKEAHHGSTKNILTLLISGDSKAILPAELLYEEMHAEQPEGGERVQRVMVDPLSADVRADSLKKSLRKLKVEFLRIAAPILGCGFDDLYQRSQRRRRRNAAIAAGSVIAVLSIVLMVVSAAAYRTWISENRYKGILADRYAQEASRYADSGKPQEALLYYTEALALKPEQPSAALGAALLMQEYAWPVLEEEADGCIWGRAFLPVEYAFAGDTETGSFLCHDRDGYMVVDGDGQELGRLPENYQHFLSDFSGWWAFCSEQDIFFYNPQSGQEYATPMPQECSPIYEESGLYYDEWPPAASMLDGGRAVVVCNGIVHLYSLDRQGGMEEIAQADVALAFPDQIDQLGISSFHEVCPSQDGTLALVKSDYLTAFYDMGTLSLKGGVQRYMDDNTGMDISRDNEYFALAYGTDYHGSLANPGGYFEVYSKDGELLFDSGHFSKEALLGVAFHPGNSGYLIAWSASQVHVWNWKEGKETAAPAREEGIREACITKDGRLLVDNRDGTVSFYSLQKPLARTAPAEEPDGQDSVKKFMTYYPHLEKFESVGKLDCGDEGILRVCFGDAWTALEMQSGDILLFGDGGERIARITPQHSGNVATLLTDPGMQYVVLVLEETVAQADSYHFSRNSIVEIWDASSLLMLSSLEWENRTVDSACITGDGVLCWSIRGVSGSLFLAAPSPDEAALRSLCSISSLSLDERQDIACKRPSLPDFQTGNWGAFISGLQTEGMLPETGDDGTDPADGVLQEMLDGLDGAEDYAQEAWFQRCDAMWQSLLDGETAYRLFELDDFYSYYFHAAACRGVPEKIGPGLEAYLELLLRLAAEDQQSEDPLDKYTMYDSLLARTLVYTQEYDGQIISFMRKSCSILEENEAAIPEDADDTERMQMEMEVREREVMAALLQSWIGMLEGDMQASLLQLPNAYMEDPFYKHMCMESWALERLMAGDVQKASELSEQWLSYLLQQDDDGFTMEENLMMHLEWTDILMTRGMVSKPVLEEYLCNIDLADFGFKIVEVPLAVQEAGMRLGDLVTSINGQRVTSLYQCLRIKQDEGFHTMEVKRDWGTAVVTLTDSAGIRGKMVCEADVP